MFVVRIVWRLAPIIAVQRYGSGGKWRLTKSFELLTFPIFSVSVCQNLPFLDCKIYYSDCQNLLFCPALGCFWDYLFAILVRNAHLCSALFEPTKTKADYNRTQIEQIEWI